MESNIILFAGGKRFSWADVRLSLLGRTVEGITEITYDDTISKENLYGRGKGVVSRGEGKYEAKASITLYDWEVNALLDAAGRGKRLQNIGMFDIPIVYDDGAGNLRTDILRNVEFTGRSHSMKSGDTSIVVKCDLILSHIDWNM
jgi:hypothetical protein